MKFEKIKSNFDFSTLLLSVERFKCHILYQAYVFQAKGVNRERRQRERRAGLGQGLAKETSSATVTA